MKESKTNAMRILDQAKITYEVHRYPHGKEAIDGVHVAKLLNEDCAMVFKTLLCCSTNKNYYVFVLPVQEELDLKKCAKAVHEKSVEMIPVKDITRISGYVRGGCSPIGMKKQFPTILHESCKKYNTILFSGGKIGLQIEMNPNELCGLIHATTSDLIRVSIY